MMQFKPFWLGLSVCFMLACSTKPKDPIDGQKIQPILIQRFDEAFFALDTNNLASGITYLNKNYPEFSNDFFSRILQLDPQLDSLKVKSFYKQYLPVYIDSRSKNITKAIDDNLNKALARFHFYFPEYRMPNSLVYFISPLNSFANVLGTNYIGVGLQTTITQANASSQIPFYCVQNLVDDYLSKNQQEKNLLYQMIESGKRQYILNTISLNTPDTLLWDYSLVQLKAVKEQESEIWQYLKEQQMLMSNERFDFLNILGNATNNSLLGASLPGNIGKYIGYRIVESYMKKQSRATWVDLKKLAVTTPSEIYAAANYQP